MIDKITELVQKEAGERDWRFHTSLVVKHAKRLAEIYNQDVQVIELAALLHDIGGYRGHWENHERYGAVEAEKILKEFGYDDETIAKVKRCILAHRGDAKTQPEKIMCDADALSHFDAVPYLIYIGLKNNGYDVQKAIEWVAEKLDRDFNTKLFMPESQRIAKKKYEAAKVILNNRA